MSAETTTARETAGDAASGETRSFSREEVLADLRVALVSRELDEVEKVWQKAGRAKFCILGAGQEIAQIAAARPLQPGDWMRSYYRGITEALVAGIVTPRQALAQVLSDSEEGHDPASGGRMMGRHFGSRLLDDSGELIDLRKQVNHASDISPTASQMGPAIGLAIASRIFRLHPEISERYPGLSEGGREVAHVSIGDASMAEGIALEAVNQAVVQQAPLVISVYDNGYGISVPSDRQIAHASISRALSGLAAEGEDGLRIFGPLEDWNYPELRAAYEEAYEHVREHNQPALVHVRVTQLEGHSSSGDHRRYKSAERLEWEESHDGIACLKDWIVEQGLATREELDELAEAVAIEIKGEAEAAWKDCYGPIIALGERAIGLHRVALEAEIAGTPADDARALAAELKLGSRSPLTRGQILIFLRKLLVAVRAAGDRDLEADVSALCKQIAKDGKARFGADIYASGKHSPLEAPTVKPKGSGEMDTGAHVIAAGFATMMAKDPRIVAYGEDVGNLGGVTTCTLGLQRGEDQVEPSIWRKSPALKRFTPKEGFGEGRVWDTAIAEGTIVGAAAGMAIRGLRPVAEIQYHDYVNYGAQQLEDEVACLRHRTRSGQEAPLLLRCHGHRLLGMWHSGSPMAMMLRMPGLRVLVPRNAVQAVAMYRAVLEHGRDPAFSVEPLLDLYAKIEVPENLDKICLPLGQSEEVRGGDDAVIVTYGHSCGLALKAAEALAEQHGLSVAVVDLQTLNPLDLNGVAREAIRRCGKVLVLDEDYTNGAAAMIAKSLVLDGRDRDGRPMLWSVDSVRTLTAPDHKPAYGADGGFFSKPQIHSIVDELCALFDEWDGGHRRLY